MRSRTILGLCFGLCFFLLAVAVSAQTISTSQIRGTIQDPSGGAVSGAEVKLIAVDTGAVRTVTSGTDGAYTLSDISVGTYRLEISKAGFNKYVQTGIVTQVGVNPTIDVALKVGAVTQEVTVEAQTVTVDTQSTGVGEVIAPQEVQDLPLNGRQLTDLLYLSGAVSQGRAFRSSYPSSAVPSIAGGAQGSVAYWLDGGTHNDPLSNQNLPLPFPDTVEEFKVETSSLPAEYGTHPSGAVNVVTKSGTNQFHGDAFEYLRNDIFDSRNTSFAAASPRDYPQLSPDAAVLAARAASPLDDLKRNQFGGTVGGPVLKDRLFFFLGWQDTIQRATNPASTTLPTQAMLDGNFQPCLGDGSGSPGNTIVLGGPYGTGGAAPNQINTSNYSPIILALESHLPVAPAADVCGLYNYQAPGDFTENQGLARVDWTQSSKNTIFGRYFITNWNQPPGNASLPPADGGLLIAAIDGQANRVQNLTLGDTYLISQNIVNSFRATGNRSKNLTLQNNTLDLNDLYTAAGVNPASVNIYQLGPSVSKFFANYMAGFDVNGGFQGFTASTPSIQPYDTLDFRDDLSWTRGPHQFSFGGEFINLRAFADNFLLNQGQFTFDGTRTGSQLPSEGLADYLLGWTSATGGFAQDAPIPSLQHQNIFSLYAQDAWKVNRRLTVTAGIRWDPFFGHTDPKGHVVSISIPDLVDNIHSTKFPEAPAGYLFEGDPGGPRNNKLTRNALDKWSPRIGVAWQPTGDSRLVVRAGFGVFWDFPNFSYDQFGFEEPYGGAVTVPANGCTTTCLTNPWANPFQFTDQQGNIHAGEDPFPQFVGTGPQNAAYLPNSLVFSYPQTIKPTYVMQYNLSVEKQVGSSWLISVSYLGNQQRHLWGNNEENPSAQGPCPPGYPLPAQLGPCVPGPCPPGLPPFACPAGLATHRLLAKYDAPATGEVGPQGGNLYGETLLLEEGGTGNYNGLLLSAQHQFAHHFTSTTNYTWSHCISDNYTTTLGFFLAAEAEPFNRHYDRGNCPSADTHNVFNQSLVAETPHFSNRVEDILLDHWRISVSSIVQSGIDISPVIILDFSGSGNGLTQRPDLVGAPYCAHPGRTCWLNPESFAPPAAYSFGNLKNNSLFGPGSFIVNTSISRLFPITEHQQIEFRWDVFNVPNHTNLYAPSTFGAGIGVPTYGQPAPATTAGLGALAQTVNDPRIMQFALKYTF